MMPFKTVPDRATEYRCQAEETRTKAEATLEPGTRSTLLQIADTWDRMADYEEMHQPPKPSTDR